MLCKLIYFEDLSRQRDAATHSACRTMATAPYGWGQVSSFVPMPKTITRWAYWDPTSSHSDTPVAWWFTRLCRTGSRRKRSARFGGSTMATAPFGRDKSVASCQYSGHITRWAYWDSRRYRNKIRTIATVAFDRGKSVASCQYSGHIAQWAYWVSRYQIKLCTISRIREGKERERSPRNTQNPHQPTGRESTLHLTGDGMGWNGLTGNWLANRSRPNPTPVLKRQ
jgi:hypothetical protein